MLHGLVKLGNVAAERLKSAPELRQCAAAARGRAPSSRNLRPEHVYSGAEVNQWSPVGRKARAPTARIGRKQITDRHASQATAVTLSVR